MGIWLLANLSVAWIEPPMGLQDYSEYKSRAIAVRGFVKQGLPGFLTASSLSEYSTSIIAEDFLTVNFEDSEVGFDLRSGRTTNISSLPIETFPEPPFSNISISQSQAENYAKLLHGFLVIASGVNVEIGELSSSYFSQFHGGRLRFVFDISSTFSSISYYPRESFWSHIELEHSTGRLVTCNPPSRSTLPAPPQSLTPIATAVEASATGASYLSNVSDPPPVIDLMPTRLCLLYPPSHWNSITEKWFSSQNLQDFAANKSILAYVTTQATLGSYSISKGVYADVADCYVDAISGSLVTVVRWGMPGGGGSPSKSEKPVPFSGELDEGQTSVIVGQRSAHAKKGAMTPGKYKFSSGERLIIRRGKLSFSADFDSENETLKVYRGRSKTVIGKPNLELTSVVRKVIGLAKPK